MKKSTMRNSIFLAQLLLSQNVVAFFAANSCRGSIKSNKISTEARMFFAEEVNESDSPSIKKEKSMEAEDKPHSLQVDLVSSDDAQFLNMAGSFLVDNFWLKSEHHKINSDSMSTEARMNLVVEQCADLQEKHGERMGKRLLNSCVFGALDTESKEMVGVATLKATLLVSENVLEGERAEVIAKNAVAALGPKQRREYKDASIGVIASELLSPDSKAIVVLSNLAVSLSARGKGIAGQICNETELLAKSWGYNEIWLLVESENEAARKLYEKIGYDVAYKKEDEIALRADVETGSFIETRADTLVLFKNLAD